MELERIPSKQPYQTLTPDYSIQGPVVKPEESVGLKELASAIWERKVSIAVVAIAGLLTGLSLSFLTPPNYRARASLQLVGFTNDQLLREATPSSPTLQNASPEHHLQNAVKLLESETLAARIADKLKAQVDTEPAGRTRGLKGKLEDFFPFLRPAPLTPQQKRLKLVRKAFSVRTSLQSQVIELFYLASTPGLAVKGADTAAAEFVNLNREARWQLANDTTEWLNKQAAGLKGTLEQSNQQLQDFAKAANLVFAGKQSTLAEEGVRQVQDALVRAQADRAAKQAKYEAGVDNPSDLSAGSPAESPLRQSKTDLQNLRRELAELETMYTPNNYKVLRVQAKIAETEKAIEAERKEALDRLHAEYLAAARLEKLLSETQAVQLKVVEQQMAQERRYDVKKGEIDATQRLYESMLQKAKEAGAASTLRTTNVRIIDTASLPATPYSPNPPLNMAIGLAVGMLGGVGLAIVRAGSDDKVKKPSELLLPDVPELGVIPSAKFSPATEPKHRWPNGFGGHIFEPGSAPAKAPDASMWSESFRATLTSILFSEHLTGGTDERVAGKTLVVSSIDVQEGKTTVLANLGIAAAERKYRVLLVDADLRRPRLHEQIGVSNTWGLTDLLRKPDLADFSEKSLIGALVKPTRIPNLWTLPSGPVTAAAFTLLYSSDLAALLQRFRREFDLVLVDSPPTMLFADGRLLGRMADGLVMVVRANTRSRVELRCAYQQMAQDRIRFLGTIFNDCKIHPYEIRSYKQYQTLQRRHE